MIGSHLMAYFMHYIVDVEIISLGYAISRRSKTAAFLIVCADTTNTTCVTTATGSSKQVPDIVVRFSND